MNHRVNVAIQGFEVVNEELDLNLLACWTHRCVFMDVSRGDGGPISLPEKC